MVNDLCAPQADHKPQSRIDAGQSSTDDDYGYRHHSRSCSGKRKAPCRTRMPPVRGVDATWTQT